MLSVKAREKSLKVYVIIKSWDNLILALWNSEIAPFLFVVA